MLPIPTGSKGVQCVFVCAGVPKFSVAFTCVCVRKQQHTINNNNNIANTPSGGLPRSHSAEPAASTLSLSAASAEKVEVK